MKSTNGKPMIGHRQPLVRNLLVLDGISRAGKFLLANVVHGFDGIEPVQYFGLLEHYPIFASFGLMGEEIVYELLRSEVDTHCYEMLIGRNLNLRRSDKSCIYNVPNYRRYLRRCEEPDGDAAIRKFYKRRAYSFFIAHELMPNIKVCFRAFPRMKVVSLQRSPVGLVHSWYRRGLARRLGVDSKLFVPPFRGRFGPYPWYLHGNERLYARLGEMDRTILSILTLQHQCAVAYNRLRPREKARILFVTYEELLSDPRAPIARISRFLRREPLPAMRRILKREQLPNPRSVQRDAEKLEEIQSLATPSYAEQLAKAQREYVAAWL